MLTSHNFDADKGYNTWNYNLKVEDDTFKKLKNKKLHITDGRKYLSKGNYTVKIGKEKSGLNIN